MAGYVYIMTNSKHGTLYIGVTADLEGRVFDHREGRGSKFTQRYSLTRLVWYDQHDHISDAIQREKSLKRWYRQWKIDLIEAMNPKWNDLYLVLNN
ncbi:MAG: GIY-YIG nuclease family protein [Rhizobiaceae bacterium]